MLAIWLASNERPVSWHMFRFVVTFTNNARSKATPTKPGTKRSLIWLAASIRHPLGRPSHGFVAGGLLKVQTGRQDAFQPELAGVSEHERPVGPAVQRA